MDSAVSSGARFARIRNRGPLSKKQETPSYRNDDDDDDDQCADGLDGDRSRRESDKRVRTTATGGRRLDAASGPTRTTKSRVKGESSQKRKEQNRVAQRAFRQRQKTYFIDLEKQLVEQSTRIQTISRSNQSLMEMMERLQSENIALKAVKAPSVTGIPPLSDPAFDTNESTGLDLPGVDEPDAREAREPSGARPRGVEAGEDVLVSVNDLAPVNKKKKKRTKSSTRRPSTAKPVARSSATSPCSRSVRLASPEQIEELGPAYSSDYYRRQSSNASHGSGSQTSALVASDSPRAASFSGACSREPAQMNVEQATETINNPTWGTGEWGLTTRSWTTPRGSTSTDASASSDLAALVLFLDGMTSTSQQLPQQSVDQDRFSKDTHHAGFPQPPYTASLYDQQQQQRQKQHQQRSFDPVRKYSEALRRYHAEAPVSPMVHVPCATVDDPMRRLYDQTQAGAVQVDQSMPGRSLDDNMASASHNAWMSPWQWNGNGWIDTSRIPLEQNMKQAYRQLQASHQSIPQPTSVTSTQPSQAGWPAVQEQSQQLPNQAAYQAKMFAGVASGLKSEAHGGMMPFAGSLTPIDVLGPLDTPFQADFYATQFGQVGRDPGDLDCGGNQTYGIDVQNASMTSDGPIGNPSVSL